MQRPSRIHVSLALIVLLGLSLRCVGLRQDLPYSHSIDEIGVIYDSLKMGAGDLNPHCFYYPTLWYYVLFGSFGIFYLIGHALGTFATAADFAFAYLKDATVFFLIARGLSVLMGTLLILITYHIARRLYEHTTGLAAAFFVAVSPLLVEYSHLAIVDVPMATILSFAFLAIASLLTKPRFGAYVASGAAIGLATATKYPALAALCPLVAAHLFSRGGVKGKVLGTVFSPRLACAIGAIVLFFLAVCPWPILDSAKFFEDLAFQKNSALVQWPGWGSAKNACGHFTTSVLPHALGIPVYLCAWAGIGLALLRKEKAGILLLSFLAPYLAIFFFSRMPHDRFMIPVVPLFAIFSASFLSRSVAAGKKRGTLVAILALLLALPAFQGSIKICRWFLLKNTAVASSEWIKTHVSPGAKIFMAADVPLPFSTASISRLHKAKMEARKKYDYRKKTDMFFALQDRLADDTAGFDIEEMPQLFYVGLRGEGDFSQEWIGIDTAREEFRADRYDYIVDNTTAELPFSGERGMQVPARYGFIKAFFDELQRRTPVKTFAPEPGKYRGDVIKIWKMKEGNVTGSLR